MKKLVFLLVSFPLMGKSDVHTALSTNRKLVHVSHKAELHDQIAAVIYTTEEPIVLTKKDFERTSINGAEQTQDEIVLNHIMAHVARVVYKMDASDEVIEKYIQSIIQQNGLTRPQIIKMFNQAGYSYEEGVEALKMMYLIENLLNYKIKSRLVVTEEQIKNYYKEHPEYDPAGYKIQVGFIPTSSVSQEVLDNWETQQKTFADIAWTSDAYWLEEHEMGEQSASIKKLKVGELSHPELVEGGYEVIKLVEKRAKTLKLLEERYKIIADQLREPMFEKMFKDFKKQLLAEYEIIYY